MWSVSLVIMYFFLMAWQYPLSLQGESFSSSIFPFTEMPKVFSRLFVLPLFPIGRLFLRSGENIRKEELHFVYSSGNIETVSFYSVSQGLEKRAVCRSPDFGLCAQLFASDVSPAAFV